MQQYLITSDDVINLSRAISKNIDPKKIESYIRETEDIEIKNSLGDSLFIDLKENMDKYSDLMNGGVYEVNGEKKIFSGLTIAISYYAFAKLMRNGDYNVTNYGTIQKNNEYSSNAVYKEKVDTSNSAFSVADSYLKDCINYLNASKDKYPLYKGNGKVKSCRTICRIIGE